MAHIDSGAEPHIKEDAVTTIITSEDAITDIIPLIVVLLHGTYMMGKKKKKKSERGLKFSIRCC